MSTPNIGSKDNRLLTGRDKSAQIPSDVIGDDAPPITHLGSGRRRSNSSISAWPEREKVTPLSAADRLRLSLQ
jgi:hypothetical protein